MSRSGLLHDETYEPGPYGNVNSWWDHFSWGGPYYSASVSNSSTAPWGYDVTRGHIEIFHYGKGPSVVYARDQQGYFIGAIAYNEWAPLVSIAGYRTAGGFVPNTTRHRVFNGGVSGFEAVMQFDKMARLETVVRMAGFI